MARERAIKGAARSVDAAADEVTNLIRDFRAQGFVEMDISIPTDSGPLLKKVTELMGLNIGDEVALTMKVKTPKRQGA